MPTTPPFPIAMGQRTLAAIVFTDVVGYSARMQKEEEGTLSLLELDFATMKEFSDGLSGVILKTTGDGLLIYFSSAVNAVTWAVKTQRHFAERSRTELLTKILRHRVGVHVGDVIRTEDDVVGDGVNIAARVQAEARTGGVCISQAAYDMVKNRMELHVARMVSRQLKNIAESVPIYEVLLDGPGLVLSSPTAEADGAEPKLDPAAKRRRLLVAALIVGVIGGGAVAAWRIYRGHADEIAESHAMQAAFDRARESATVPVAEVKPQVVIEKNNEPPLPVAAVSSEPDFARLTTSHPPSAGVAGEPLLASAVENVALLEDWRKTQLPRYTRRDPLLVRELDGAAQEWRFYMDAQQNIYFGQGGAARKFAWSELTIDRQAAIIVSALRDASPPPARAVVRGAEAFAFVNGLPDMAEALIRARNAGAAR